MNTPLRNIEKSSPVSILRFTALLAFSFWVYVTGSIAWAQTITITSAPYNATTGSADNAAAIQAAINAVGSGGTVVVPAGTFLSGPITLKSNMTFQLAAGAILRMTAFGTFPQNTDFVYGSGLTNITINGSGTLDGQGAAWWTDFNNGNPDNRPPAMIYLSKGKGVTLMGITVKDSPKFHVQLLGTGSNIYVGGVSITAAWPSPNTDGIDLRGTNVLIENSYISDGDDMIQLGGTDPTSGVTIQNCTFGTGHGLSIGGYTQGGVSNLLVNNCTFNGSQYGIRWKTGRDRGGVMNNLTYSNINMTGILLYPFFLTSWYPNPSSLPPTSDTAAATTSTTPYWNNITLRNITASTASSGAKSPGIMWAVPEAPVSNVLLDAVTVTGPTGVNFEFHHARGVTINCNCRVDGQQPPTDVGAFDATITYPTCGGPTPTFTKTNTPVPPTATFTHTNTPIPPTSTFTFTPTKTNTPVPPTSTFTSTPTKTNTPVPPTATFTSTATASATSTKTNTPIPPTMTFTSTATPSATPTKTNSPVPPTSTFTSTATSSATPTKTNIPVPSTSTFTATVTNTSSFTHTNTPVPPTFTFTSTATNSATATKTNSPVPPTSTNTTVPPTATNTPVPPTATNTATLTKTNSPVPPTATNTPVPPTSTNTPVPSTSTLTPTPVPPTATNTAVPPSATFTNSPVPPTSTSTNTSVPPTATNTPVPPTNTSTQTPVPPTGTNTAVPPTATSTPIPPTATHTNSPVPPTSTSTPVPPTSTNTSTHTPVPPTSTNTPVPPTSTSTNTPVPPTPTQTPIPPTATFTAVPPTATLTPTPSFTSTQTATLTQASGVQGVTYPNPVSGGTFNLQITGMTTTDKVDVQIQTTAFRKVNELTFHSQGPGTVNLVIPATDATGAALSNGVYYVIVRTEGARIILKLMVLK